MAERKPRLIPIMLNGRVRSDLKANNMVLAISQDGILGALAIQIVTQEESAVQGMTKKEKIETEIHIYRFMEYFKDGKLGLISSKQAMKPIKTIKVGDQ